MALRLTRLTTTLMLPQTDGDPVGVPGTCQGGGLEAVALVWLGAVSKGKGYPFEGMTTLTGDNSIGGPCDDDRARMRMLVMMKTPNSQSGPQSGNMTDDLHVRVGRRGRHVGPKAAHCRLALR